MTRLSILTATAIALSGPALSQSAETIAPRCSVVGQMAVSNWVGMLGSLSSGRPAEVDPGLRRTLQTVELYEATGCDAALLRSAFDCLLTTEPAVDDTREDVALRCMREAGLISAE